MIASSSTAGLRFVETFIAAARGFAGALERSDLSARVPACPQWTAYDLVVHLGNVHGWAATIVETGMRSDQLGDKPRHRRPGEVAKWYAAKAEDLYAVLRAADPQAEAWNFAGVQRVNRFWTRRQTHETTVHRIDLDQSAGRETSLDPILCTDGIAEVFEVFVPRMHARGSTTVLEEPLTVRTLDTDHAWTLQPRHDAAPAVAVRTEPGADLIEGPAEALLKLLWRRGSTGHPDVTYVGNSRRIESFVASRLTP